MKAAIHSRAKPAKRKRSRRKDDRPHEIVAAAIDLFVERGFGATRLSDVAERAGIAKGTVYLYCESKTDLFLQVARTILDEAALPHLPERALSFSEFVAGLLAQAARNLSDGRFGGLVRLIITESRCFPELAEIWHAEVSARLLGVLVAEIKEAQARGEVRMGEPRLFAFSLVGPLLAASLFRDVFSSVDAPPPDLAKLATQHADAILRGILVSPSGN